MPRRDPTAETFAAISRIRANPAAPEAEAVLRHALASPISAIVERAAPLVADGGWKSLVGDLESAFERFRVSPDRDQDSLAKVPIVESLARLGAGEEVMLVAIHHVQLEYGTIEDEAGPRPVDGGSRLRATAIVLLAESGYRYANDEAAVLLHDIYPEVRVGAIRALMVEQQENVHLLLRHFAAGQSDIGAVMIECFRALLLLDPRGFEVVVEFLGATKLSTATMAAIALGESARPEALKPLISMWRERREEDDETSRATLLAIASLRLDDGLEFLLDLLRDGNAAWAYHALAALQMFRHDRKISEQIRLAARDSVNPGLGNEAERLFPEP